MLMLPYTEHSVEIGVKSGDDCSWPCAIVHASMSIHTHDNSLGELPYMLMLALLWPLGHHAVRVKARRVWE